VPPFRGESRSDSRCAYLQFRTINDARVGLHKLAGRVGPNGETLHVALSRAPALGRDQLWRWAHVTEERLEKVEDEEAYFGAEWEGLGFGTGAEEVEEEVLVEVEEGGVPVGRGRGWDGLDDGPVPETLAHGTRGGRGHFKDWSRSRASEKVRERARARARVSVDEGLVVDRSGLMEHDDLVDMSHLHQLLRPVTKLTYGEEGSAASPTFPPPFPAAAESELEDPKGEGGKVGDSEPVPASALETTTRDRGS